MFLCYIVSEILLKTISYCHLYPCYRGACFFVKIKDFHPVSTAMINHERLLINLTHNHQLVHIHDLRSKSQVIKLANHFT